jgi:hypothetical protein
MAAPIGQPPFQCAVAGASGLLAQPWSAFVTKLVDAVKAASSDAEGGVITLGTYTKAVLPTATTPGQMIYVSDATGLHVTGSVCFSTAAGAVNWIDTTTGVIVV